MTTTFDAERLAAETGILFDETREVLVVDDDESCRRLVGDLLRPKGVAVIEASSMAEALDLVGGTDPGVALVDYHLPDGDGLDLAVQLRIERPLISVVMMTGDVRARSLWEAMDEGRLHDLVAKPFVSLPLLRERLVQGLLLHNERRKARDLAQFLQAAERRTRVAPVRDPQAAALRDLADRIRADLAGLEDRLDHLVFDDGAFDRRSVVGILGDVRRLVRKVEAVRGRPGVDRPPSAAH